MIYIGIDPGKKGGIGVINEHSTTFAIPYSDEALKRCLSEIGQQMVLDHRDVICCLEQVHAMPKQGVSSTFSFGANYGFIKGVLEICGIPYQEIPPKRWKKEFGLDGTKAKSIEVCQKLCPEVNLLATERSRVPHDGMAEALLMAIYARRKL